MTGVAGMPPSVPPTVGGDTGVSAPETRRSQTERARYQEAMGQSAKAENVNQGNLEKLVKDANQSLRAITSLHISLDRDNNQMVVQVVDKANDNKVIRQFPSEDVMELSKRMDALKELKGFLFNTKA